MHYTRPSHILAHLPQPPPKALHHTGSLHPLPCSTAASQIFSTLLCHTGLHIPISILPLSACQPACKLPAGFPANLDCWKPTGNLQGSPCLMTLKPCLTTATGITVEHNNSAIQGPCVAYQYLFCASQSLITFCVF